MLKSLIFSILVLGLSACSALTLRSESSGYAASEDSSLETIEQFYNAKKNKYWREAQEQLGLTDSRELTESEVDSIQTRVRLNQLENRLESSQEKRQYFSYKPYFKTDRERVQFLSIPTKESRERWIQSRGIASVDNAFDRFTSELIENNDIAKGMTRKAVEQSWGEPEAKEFAGNPMYGNERWRYTKLVSTQDGYQQETRIIYFEAGRVAGWETHQ